MRVVIIGGAGHVGTYLVPYLVEAGHEVINISRGQREAYQPHAAWKAVQQVRADREAEDREGTFGQLWISLPLISEKLAPPIVCLSSGIWLLPLSACYSPLRSD